MWVDPKTWHPLYGDHGYMNKTAVVTFPLSPQVMVGMSWDDKGTHALAGRDTVTALNYLRAMHADEYLYAILNTRSSGAWQSARSSPGRA